MKKQNQDEKRLRLAVYRSNRYIYAQIIDDEKRQTSVMATDLELKGKEKSTNTARAQKVGEWLAQKALKKGIKLVFFDRRKYHYQGRVKALAEGARKGGLVF